MWLLLLFLRIGGFFVFYIFLIVMFLYLFGIGGVMLDLFLFSFLGVDFSLTLIFDFLSFGFFGCVSLVSSLVFFYSVFYMAGTVDIRRFGGLVVLFVASMFILVFSGNFIFTMIGWDGLGLVSFCLVIFYSNFSSLESGLVTVFRNRIGDAFFLLSFFFFFRGGYFGVDLFSYLFLGVFLLFIFFGAITKSAQVPFSAWLPAAMAAPTPVSSLVHSSTLVTAGVYVLIRFNYVFFSFLKGFCVIFFIFTIVLAGGIACLEGDLKKIVAISTLSQLGLILFIVCIGSWTLSFIHIVIHAFFKSILFLGTGSLMSQLRGGQDSRFFGGGRFSFAGFVYFVVRCLCLAGFPFFIGFYSKDLIILGSSFFGGSLLFFLFLVGCIFTVCYRLRLIYLSYFSLVKGPAYLFMVEDWIFFFPVRMLFFIGWVLGGVFYYFFSGGFLFFFFFDFIKGLVIILLGVSFFFLLRWVYKFYFFLASISFLRWISSSGLSFVGKFLFWGAFDKTWIEYFGGSGVYRILSFSNKFLFIFDYVGVGLLIFYSGLIYFWFF